MSDTSSQQYEVSDTSSLLDATVPDARSLQPMARWSRRVWILELAVYGALMLVFGALVEPLPGNGALQERAERLFCFGAFAAMYIAIAVSARVQRRRGLRARPAAIEALETLDLSSPESRANFVNRTAPYAKAYRDSVGGLISTLADALRWSRPERRDFTVLAPILDEARERIRLERRMQPLVERVLEDLPESRTDSLRLEERFVLLTGMVMAPVTVLTLSGRPNNPDPIARAMLAMVLGFATFLVIPRWFWRRQRREYGMVWALLRRNGLEHDALTVQVVSEALSRKSEKLD